MKKKYLVVTEYYLHDEFEDEDKGIAKFICTIYKEDNKEAAIRHNLYDILHSKEPLPMQVQKGDGKVKSACADVYELSDGEPFDFSKEDGKDD